MPNLLATLYTRYWVPILGRFISILIPIIEGKKADKPPTYKLEENK